MLRRWGNWMRVSDLSKASQLALDMAVVRTWSLFFYVRCLCSRSCFCSKCKSCFLLPLQHASVYDCSFLVNGIMVSQANNLGIILHILYPVNQQILSAGPSNIRQIQELLTTITTCFSSKPHHFSPRILLLPLLLILPPSTSIPPFFCSHRH